MTPQDLPERYRHHFPLDSRHPVLVAGLYAWWLGAMVTATVAAVTILTGLSIRGDLATRLAIVITGWPALIWLAYGVNRNWRGLNRQIKRIFDRPATTTAHP